MGSRELVTLCSVWTRLLAPFIPFTAEHLWKEMGNKDLVSFAPWPVADEKLIKHPDRACRGAPRPHG